MGRPRGFEPPTSGTTNRRSNQLSYDRHTTIFRAVKSRMNDGQARSLVGSTAFGQA